MSDDAREFVASLLGETTAVVCGDPTNEAHFNKTRDELHTALGADGKLNLACAIEKGDLIGTVTVLARALVAMNEDETKALYFATQVAPRHRLPQHMR